MSFEVKIGKKTVTTKLISRSGNLVVIDIDNRRYEVDIVEMEKGIYSIIYNHKSYRVELAEMDNAKKYAVNTFKASFDVEIIDAESKYLQNRQKGVSEESEKIISTPMPGKVIRIFVSQGEEVKAGQIALVVEAMKMQNEYMIKTDSKIKQILIKEGDIINAHEPLIILE